MKLTMSIAVKRVGQLQFIAFKFRNNFRAFNPSKGKGYCIYKIAISLHFRYLFNWKTICQARCEGLNISTRKFEPETYLLIVRNTLKAQLVRGLIIILYFAKTPPNLSNVNSTISDLVCLF